MKEKKVFLGGTVTGCNPLYGWRGKLIPLLKINYFNPVVRGWNKQAIEEEYRQKNEVCAYQLYVITPEIRGYLSIAEIGTASALYKEKAIFCVIDDTFENDKKFTKLQLRSLDNVGELVVRNGGKYFKNLQDVADYLNKQ